jgi:hypothetical protein
VRFIRYEASTPNARGAHIGVFGLANGLRSANRLTAADLDWLKTNNAYGDAAYPDPATVDATLFDKVIHPYATCWFKSTAEHLLQYVDGYLELLTRYGVAWRRLECEHPGRVLYEDDVQVVLEPDVRTRTTQHGESLDGDLGDAELSVCDHTEPAHSTYRRADVSAEC